MLLNLHLQSLVVCILSIQVDLFYLIQIGLCALLAYDVLFPLKLIFLLLRYLGRDENCLHMSLIDISLFFFSFALMLLVPLLVNEKRVPVEIVLWLCLLYINHRVRRYSSILINNDGVHLVEDIRAYVTAPDNLHSCILLAFD